MNEQTTNNARWTWTTSMAVGAAIGGVVTLAIYALTGDPALYAWPLPIGVVAGLSYSRDKARKAGSQ